ncbi:MAG: TolB family protein [Prevotella sp.]|nr:TolB family protein [Prevotella sp.]
MTRTLLTLLLIVGTVTAKAQQKYTSSRLEIIDITNARRTIVRDFPYVIEAPNWSKDGRWIVYNSQGKLYKIRSNGKGEPQPINTSFAENCNNDHVISSKGRHIAISHHTKEDFQSRIYIVPFAGGTPQLVTPLGPSYLHGWSPDGQELAYCAQRNGDWNVYVIPASGGEERQLTTAKGLDDGPEYDPSGKHIWFNSARTGEMQIWKMKADGTEQTQMTRDTERNAWFPHVSPDGKTVAYIAYHRRDIAPDQHLPGYDVDLMVMSSDGRNAPEVLASLFGGQGSMNVNSWAPDSKRLCFVSYNNK